jgi:hypothetical protein
MTLNATKTRPKRAEQAVQSAVFMAQRLLYFIRVQDLDTEIPLTNFFRMAVPIATVL